MQKLDFKQDFSPSFNLIEASAGSGKTFSIVNLFLKFLIEKDVSCDEILVLTFTNLATNELKIKIRDRIQEAYLFFEGKREDEDLEKYKKNPIFFQSAKEKIQDTFFNFSDAQIYSIHGFSASVLMDNFFESSISSDVQVVENEDNLILELSRDFYRRTFYDEDHFFLDYIYKNYRNVFPEYFSRFFKYCSNFNLVKIQNSSKKEIEEETKEAREDLFKFYDFFKRYFLENKERIKILFEEICPKLDGRTYSIKKIFGILDELEKKFSKNFLFIHKKDIDLEKFEEGFIFSKLKKNKKMETDEFFQFSSLFSEKQKRLEDAFFAKLKYIKIKFLEEIKTELAKKKEDLQVLSFNDLLEYFSQALNNQSLREKLKKQYKILFVDEFQDTNSLQYEILNKIFTPKQHIAFFVGDPKQSIYAFRGADIFSYLKAAKSSLFNKYTLPCNYRSSKNFVAGINAIFSQKDNPFYYKDIKFRPAAAYDEDGATLIINDIKEAPINVYFLEGKKEIEEILYLCAYQINKILSSDAKIDGEKIQAKDIGILFDKNDSVKKMSYELKKFKIPFVLYSPDNLFKTDEAQDFFVLLNAILNYENDNLLRRSLISSFFNFDAKRIEELNDEPLKMQKYFYKFRSWNQIWKQKGFVALFKNVLRDDVILRNLEIGDVNFKCKIENLYNIFQIINKKIVDEKFNEEATLDFLFEKIYVDSFEENQDSQNISDDEGVNILTIHKSKGLEYKIVFCPMLTGGRPKKREEDYFCYHDENYNLSLAFSQGKEDENFTLFKNELFSEKLRLLYVALTRAKNNLYFCLTDKKNFSETFSYLIDANPINLDDMAKFENLSQNNIKIISDRFLLEKPLQQNHNSSHKIKDTLFLPQFKRNLKRSFAFESFSSLLRNYEDKDFEALDLIKSKFFDEEDKNILIENPQEESCDMSIIDFPKGKKSGLFFHSLLEEIAFQKTDESLLEEKIKEKLSLFDFSLSWATCVKEAVLQVLKSKLSYEDKSFFLSDIEDENCLKELEFYFSFSFSDESKDFFLETFNIDIKEKNNVAKSFMRGFIDLIFEYNGKFFIADWKTNFLGKNIKDYNYKNLKEDIEKNNYKLQYLIYSLSLHKYLSEFLTDYDFNKHFGGVFYIYLRGVVLSLGEEGIFFDKPSLEEMDKFKTILLF